MLFDADITVCKIVKDSNYVSGGNSKLEVSFGGSSNPRICSLFESLKSLGVVPMYSDYCESKRLGNKIEIVYEVLSTSADRALDILEYRKVLIPDVCSNFITIKVFVESQVNRYLEPVYSLFKNASVDIIPCDVEKPSIEEIEKGILFIRAMNLKGFNFFRNTFRDCSPYADNYAYCTIKNNKYIILTKDRDVRKVAILPTVFEKDSLVEYMSLVSSYTSDIILEHVNEY